MLNRIVLIGRLTRDPEPKYTSTGVAVSNFAIAVDRPTRNAETGERETDFIDIVAFRKTAEFVTQYLSKGRLVAVDGRLQIRSWVAQDGTKRTRAEVIADSVQGLDRARDGDTPPRETGGYTPAPAASPAPMPPAQDDYDPFADE
jgi:single-strand DNA-binding protein